MRNHPQKAIKFNESNRDSSIRLLHSKRDLTEQRLRMRRVGAPGEKARFSGAPQFLREKLWENRRIDSVTKR
jgi:hypothetical protein